MEEEDEKQQLKWRLRITRRCVLMNKAGGTHPETNVTLEGIV